jgi:beta-lactamase class A
VKLLLLLLLPLLLISCASNEPYVEPDVDSTRARVALPEPFGPIDSTLHDSLRAIEARSGSVLGLAALHIESNWATSYRGNETFPMASVGKLPMALRFLQSVDSGRFRLDSAVMLTSADHSLGRSRFYARVMKVGGATTIHDLLEAMMVSSDNTAADVLLDMVGGPLEAHRMMSDIGLGRIDISHNEGELIMLWAGVDPASDDSAWNRQRALEKMAAAGDTIWKEAEIRLVDDPSDAAPPEQVAQLLARLQQRKLLAGTTTDTLLAMMSRAATGRARIPALLPPGTPVAHKTGTLRAAINDVGIITLPGGRGHLAIAVFIKGGGGTQNERELAIASAAALVYRHVMAMP